jgi:hypothetical protein
MTNTTAQTLAKMRWIDRLTSEETVTEMIRLIRDENWNMQAIAFAMDVTRRTVCRWATGEICAPKLLKEITK